MPVVPELFWATSDAWVVEPISVAIAPQGNGWILGGDAAAAGWGAPVFGTSRYYCADRGCSIATGCDIEPTTRRSRSP